MSNYSIKLERPGHKLDYVTPVGRDKYGDFWLVGREATGVKDAKGVEGRAVVLIRMTATGIIYRYLTPETERWVPSGAVFDKVGTRREVVFLCDNSDNAAAGPVIRNEDVGVW